MDRQLQNIRIALPERVVTFSGTEVSYDVHADITYYVAASGHVVLFNNTTRDLRTVPFEEFAAEHRSDRSLVAAVGAAVRALRPEQLDL